MLCSFSNLSDQDLNAIQELEKKLARPLLAFSCQDIRVAELSQEELSQVQELENRMGISLLAVEAA